MYYSGPSTRLLDFISDNPTIHWIKFNKETERIELVLDNHMLSTYRKCPTYAMYAFVEGLRKKAPTAMPGMVLSKQTERVWFLEFGILLHKVLEHYYKEFRNHNFDRFEFVTVMITRYWIDMEMGKFKNENEFISIGGLTGFIQLIYEFVVTYSAENEKIRVLGTEISFGKSHEVPLTLHQDHLDVDIYLSGRIDILVDDGYFISPLDHKSFAYFKGDPISRYVNDDGPTGYIFALKNILPKVVPEELFLKRDCNRILMNLISKKSTPTPKDRFKRFHIFKTEYQLEQYRQRQIQTSLRLLEDLERYIRQEPVIRNTDQCTQWFFRQCPFYDIDRQGSKESELLTIKNGFLKLPIWDTETVNSSSKEEE